MDKETERLIEHLEGNITALQASVRALILAHSDPLYAVQRVHMEIEKATSAALPTTLSEAYLEGIRKGRSFVLPTADAWRAAGVAVPPASP